MTSTREALLDAGVRLIAERGFAAVSVGDIEEAAGFTRRGGSMYKHFRSKADLLDAAIQRHVDSLAQPDGVIALLPLPDIASELLLIGRWVLARLTREESISRIIEKEGARLPHLADTMRDHISEPGYVLLAAYLDARGLASHWDSEALAVLLLGALVNIRRSTWTFAKSPRGIDDARAISTWTELCVLVIAAPAKAPMPR
jgi:AcrR family transcriptional regulator